MDLRRVLVYVLLTILVVSTLGSFAAAQDAGEKIRADDVILIHNVYDLQNMSKNLSGHYELANDIDASVTRNWNGGAGFVPIGNSSAPFNGTFDGKGYKIINLWINRSSEYYVGLFGYTTENTTIENVGLVNASVRGGTAGALVGYNYGTVNNSYATGNVNASGFISYGGGLIGKNSGNVSNSYFTGDVSASGDNDIAGGLVGDNYGNLTNSHATGNVNGSIAGGLIGYNHGITFNSYSTGNVSGEDNAGGLAGVNEGTVNNSYATGNVSGSIAGGLVGDNHEEYGIINSSYATSNVSGYYVGGLVGENYGEVDNSYATCSVNGSNYAGGMVGRNYGIINDSYATGNVNGSIAGGLIGENRGVVNNSHYDIDETLINGAHYVLRYGLYHDQFNDWLSNGKKLNIADYPSLSPNGDYYEISDVQGLKDLLGFTEDGLKFRLAADIDLSSEPGLYIPYFVGVFDGNGHVVSSNLNLSISFVHYVGIGLFGVNKGTIENIGIVKASVSGYRASVLVGDNYGNLTNSHAIGDASGDIVGGLVERNYGSIKNSYFVGNVNGSGYVGGLVGVNYYGTINNSYSTGNVSGSDDVGGLVGWNDGGEIRNTYATANVSGEDNVGGLVGANEGIVNNSYAASNTIGSSNVGGLVGWNGGMGIVNNSYATGNVSGSNYVGGLVGYNDGTVTASFWDVNTSGIDHSAGGTGLTTEKMKNKSTFLNTGWDFDNIWDIVDGQTYPFFKWQQPSRPSAPLYLSAINGTGYVNITWTNPSFDGASPITKYYIYRNGVKIAEVPATQLWYNDTDVVDGQTYTYYVTAVNAAGESPKSNEVQATPGATVPELTPGMITIVVLVSLLAALRKRRS